MMMRIAAALTIAAAAGMSAAVAAAADMHMQQEGSAQWFCGGVGAQERQQMQSELRKDANAELVFATQKRGAFVADVAFTVRPAKGGDPVLQATAGGPICLLQLPPGRYRVEAEFNGAKRSAPLTAAEQSGKPARVALAFPSDSKESIMASPEEKAQGRNAAAS